MLGPEATGQNWSPQVLTFQYLRPSAASSEGIINFVDFQALEPALYSTFTGFKQSLNQVQMRDAKETMVRGQTFELNKEAIEDL